jgi:hypothetical protein
MKGKRLSTPALAYNLHPLFKQPCPVLHRDAKSLKIRSLITDTYPQDDASFRDDIQSRHVLGDVHRVVQGQQDDRGADVQATRLGRHRRGHNQRRGQEAILILMVFPKKASVKATRLGQLGFGNDLVYAAI